jgi:hypothetical protein
LGGSPEDKGFERECGWKDENIFGKKGMLHIFAARFLKDVLQSTGLKHVNKFLVKKFHTERIRLYLCRPLKKKQFSYTLKGKFFQV